MPNRHDLTIPTVRLHEREPRRGEWVAIVVLVFAGVLLALVVPRDGGLDGVDVELIQAAQRVDGLEPLARFFNDFLNNYGIPVLWTASALAFLVQRRFDVALYFCAALLIGPMTRALKYSVDRARPSGDFSITEFPHDPSFPSGHTTTAIGFFGSWFLLAPYVLPGRLVLPVRIVCVVAIVATAYFRMWVGAHWPTDVAGALLFGSALLLSLLLAFSLAGRWWRRSRGRAAASA